MGLIFSLVILGWCCRDFARGSCLILGALTTAGVKLLLGKVSDAGEATEMYKNRGSKNACGCWRA